MCIARQHASTLIRIIVILHSYMITNHCKPSSLYWCGTPSDRLNVLKVKATELKEDATPVSICPLYELPYDCLRICFLQLSVKDLAAVARTCRHLRDFVTTDVSLWKTKMEDEFGISARSPDAALDLLPDDALAYIQLKRPDLFRQLSFAEDDAASDRSVSESVSSVRSSELEPSLEPAEPTPVPELDWRRAYLALRRLDAFGFHHLRALQSSKHPTDVSGAAHRKELVVALTFLERTLRGRQVAKNERRLLSFGASLSMSALLSSEYWQTRDLAASLLYQLVLGSELLLRDARERGLARRLSEDLNSKTLTDPSLMSLMAFTLARLVTVDASSLHASILDQEGPFHLDPRQELWWLTSFSRRGTLNRRRLCVWDRPAHALKVVLVCDESGNVLSRPVWGLGRRVEELEDDTIRFSWDASDVDGPPTGHRPSQPRSPQGGAGEDKHSMAHAWPENRFSSGMHRNGAPGPAAAGSVEFNSYFGIVGLEKTLRPPRFIFHFAKAI